MAILLDNNSKVLIQGITGKHGLFHAKGCAEYGTNIVGGVTPGKGGTFVEDFAVFDSVAEGKQKTGANVSCIFVPAPFCYDALIEAIDAEMELVICITEGVPVLDMVKVKNYLKGKKTKLIGPNCPGIISPGMGKVGIMPGYIHKQGNVGIISRSGTLTYEAVHQVGAAGFGQSTCIGIGGDPVRGLGFIECLELFNDDPDTDAIVLIGEIGGNDEEQAAQWIKKNCKKKVVSFFAGRTAPKGKRMGHAGAIISGKGGTAESKIEAMKEAGVPVADRASDIGKTLLEAMNG
ncbi:MAG: succinate--CoA ligase subunit alpha [Bacteriovoracaceae bacterium]|nr:succinate--CoA ligase subunit alpha [Bacteriovoracaceae bacterium]